MHFGDPTFAGWLIVFVYFLVVSRCYFKHAEAKKQGIDAYFWVLVGGFLLLLGLNKQLDMQTVFELSMRDLAKSHGWYAQRQLLQMTFITTLALGLLTMLILLRSFLAKSWQENKIVCFGLFLIAVFIVLRAAMFNHLSYLSTQSYLGFNAHALLELSALGVMYYGTYVRKRVSKNLDRNSAKAQSSQLMLEVFCLAEGDDVYCPACNAKAVSRAVGQRQFKCKACAAIYTVRIR